MRRRTTRSATSSRHRRPIALQRPWQRPSAPSWLSLVTLGAMLLCLLLLIFARGPISRASSRFIQYIAPDPEPEPAPTALPRPTFPPRAQPTVTSPTSDAAPTPLPPSPSPLPPSPSPSPSPPSPSLPSADAPAPLPQEVEPTLSP